MNIERTDTGGSRVTIHMVASLDGFIARRDGRVDWMETKDRYPQGRALDADAMGEVLSTIDCYVLGARTYEAALTFDQQGLGWPYGDTPTVVLSHRDLPRQRDSVAFERGDLEALLQQRLLPRYRRVWFVGGGEVANELVRRRLVDEIRYGILPVLVGDGVRFFGELDADVPLHLAGVESYDNGMVELRYELVERA